MLQVGELHLNMTEGYRLGDEVWYEPFTEDRKRLFREYQKEYGRCMGKMYQDTPDGDPDAIGWVFQKVRMYEDARSKEDKYIHEVWVTLREVKA